MSTNGYNYHSRLATGIVACSTNPQAQECQVILYNRGFRGMCKRFIRDIWDAEDDCDLDTAFSGVRFFYSYLYAFGYSEERIDTFIYHLRKLGESK